MSVPKKYLDEVSLEIKNRLKDIDDILEIPDKSSFHEESLSHLVMLRTELTNIYYELDDLMIQMNKDNLAYKVYTRRRWDIFEKNDLETRKNLKEMLSII